MGSIKRYTRHILFLRVVQSTRKSLDFIEFFLSPVTKLVILLMFQIYSLMLNTCLYNTTYLNRQINIDFPQEYKLQGVFFFPHRSEACLHKLIKELDIWLEASFSTMVCQISDTCYCQAFSFRPSKLDYFFLLTTLSLSASIITTTLMTRNIFYMTCSN